MKIADAVQVRATEDVQAAHRMDTTRPAAPPASRMPPHSPRAARLPVRALLLPRRHRAAFTALAGFYRETRTLGTPTPAHRARLDRWEEDINRLWDGGAATDAVLAPLHAAGVPRAPLLALLDAQRTRHATTAFATYEDLLAYCAAAANPVGRLALSILGRADAERIACSDAICTALQLTAFWRDVARDYARGRIYLPQEDMSLFAVTRDDLARAIAMRRADTNIRALIAFETERAVELFHRGAPLVAMLRGRARLDCALLISDGRAMLAAIARQGYDPIATRPHLSRSAKAGTFFGAFRSIGTETLHSR